MATHVFRLFYRPVLVAPKGSLSGYLRPSVGRRGLSERGNSHTDESGEEERADSRINAVDDPYHGISSSVFSESTVKVLLSPVSEGDVEMKPDGLIYLPEIKYRRILNQAFGPGGWALMPRGDTLHFQNDQEGAQLITREYALFCRGKFIAQAIGEHVFYGKSNLQYGKACESAKSNALMRCCKDLGIASELWDPQFITQWKQLNGESVWCENQRTREKKVLWRKKDAKNPFPYPWKQLNKTS